ncbi:MULTISPECIES: DUF308 domain-containing protein [Methanobacterium]|jgi:uncharacterized membrane protein HdeD (DUF308 family)|uniref:DUF308 domain-containing protein n=1 Tax=Methanobacterium veterum TaxID=408577 RepID=A0A9E5A3G9_9EURY|nr:MULTISPECIES: DUF308 domain-containing protein [Methanobacterium]MCZ3366959.1 DUF308 domain-containing protein [Methanobacterium veterum]MCZ3373894.1 DUF308 domain-containing protein [Methanobacterium veterum]
MQTKTSGLILIVLGLIIIAFPLLGILPFSLLLGISVLFLGIGLLIAGVIGIRASTTMGVVELILGIIALILGIGIIINPGFFSFLVALLIYIAGIFLIIIGIMAFFAKIRNKWVSIVPIILGLIYILIGSIVADPFYLGALIGIWLLITGIIMLFQD